MPPTYGPHLAPSCRNNLRGLLANREVFLHAEDGNNPPIKMAISRYQFEAIHPFYDGTGRTGQILNILYLIVRYPEF
ncbi:MAG: Fic family protein [Thiotrichales bacterium]